MRKIVLTFGLIVGLVITLMMFMNVSLWEGEMNFELAELLGYLTMIIAFSSIFFGIRSFRDKHQEGSISFGKAFQIGIYITLIASALYVASWMIFSDTIAPDFMDQYYEHAIEKLREAGKSEEFIRQQMQQMEQFKELYKNPVVKMGMTFMEIFPVGLIISLICSLILKRKKAV